MFVYFVLFFQALIASGTHIVAKVVVKDIDPLTLTMLRSVMAAVGLLLIAGVRKTKFKFEKKDYPMIIFLSFLAIPVNQFLFLLAMKYTTPTNAALLYGSSPAAVLLISNFIKREPVNWKKGFGVAIAFCGIFLIVFEKGIDLKSAHAIGNICLFIAMIAWAVYTVQGRVLVLKYGAFTTSSITMILGTIMFIPIGFLNTIEYDYSELTINHWGGLLYLSLGTSIFAYLLWYYALSRIEATRVAIFANLQPILTTILAVILLNQTITLTFLLGGSIALTGVILAQYG
jgi:drug/metabolite transporter (DMT)-like permease